MEGISRSYAELLATATVGLLARGGPGAVSIARMTALARPTSEALRQAGFRRSQVLAEVGRVLADRWLRWSVPGYFRTELGIPVTVGEREQVRAYRAWATIADAERSGGSPWAAEHLARAAAHERAAAVRDRRSSRSGGGAEGEASAPCGEAEVDREASIQERGSIVLLALVDGLRDAVSRLDAPCDPADARSAVAALTPEVWRWAESRSEQAAAPSAGPDSLAS